MTTDEVNQLLIGQRVIVPGAYGTGDEIGTVTKIDREILGPHVGVWVYRASMGCASCFARTSVRLLPNGQL